MSTRRADAQRPTLLRALLGMILALGIVFGGAGIPAVAYDEGTIVSLANQSRAAEGLGGLVHNSALDAVALDWAYQMAANGALSHNPHTCDQIPGGWMRCGENVAQGYSSGVAVHEGWMNSPGHRANILGDYTDIGVALIESGGTTWGVQVFATYAGSGLPLQAAAEPEPAATEPAPAEQAPEPADPEPAPAELEPEPQAPPAESAPLAPAAASPAPAPAQPPPAAIPAESESTAATRKAGTASPTPTQSQSPSDAAAPSDVDGEASALISARETLVWWSWILAAALVATGCVALLPPVRRRLLRR